MRWFCILLIASVKVYPIHLQCQVQNGVARVQASGKYSFPSLIERIFLGSNYRKEWSTVVSIPVFEMRKTNFKIVEMGGGQQTTSLELVDEQGREWALRSVDKNVKPPNEVTNNKIMKAIIQDHVSGSYPYAGLSVYDIANAAGVPAGKQFLFFVPDDSAFGEHRVAMANKVFILVNNQPQVGDDFSTEEMLKRLGTEKNSYVDSKEYLKARLVDWLIADWDRHDDQWRWTERKTDSGVAFYVVPRDRDQAFYRSNGLLAKFAGLSFMPHFNKFNKSARGIKGLSRKTWSLDRKFLISLSKQEWESLIKEFQANVSDSVIETAIKKQPPEIFAIRGDKLIKKLKSRRDGLLKNVLKYRTFLLQYDER